MKILKPWICGGRLAAPGMVLDLPAEFARSGLEKGLCLAVAPESVPPKAKNRKRRAGKTAS